MNTLPNGIADIDYDGQILTVYFRDDITEEDLSAIESIFQEYASPFTDDDEDFGFLHGFNENLDLIETPCVYAFPCGPDNFATFRNNWCFKERFFCPCMGMWEHGEVVFDEEVLFGTNEPAKSEINGELTRKKFPRLAQIKQYPEWEGINAFLNINPVSEQGKQNEKEEREGELRAMLYADGTPVGEFVDMDREVRVYCRKHGVFPVTPQRHLAGEGCPVCNRMGESELRPSIRN